VTDPGPPLDWSEDGKDRFMAATARRPADPVDLSDAEAAALFRLACEDETEFPADWRLRPGGSWAAKGGLTTLVAYDPAENPDDRGRRPSDINAGTVLNPYFAKAVCDTYNQRRPAPAAGLPWQAGYVAYADPAGTPVGEPIPVRYRTAYEPGMVSAVLAESVTLPPCPIDMCAAYALLGPSRTVLMVVPTGRAVRAGDTLHLAAGR
jgi:hypothetical protein